MSATEILARWSAEAPRDWPSDCLEGARRAFVDTVLHNRPAPEELRRLDALHTGRLVTVDVENWDGESNNTEDAKFTFVGRRKESADLAEAGASASE